MKDDNVLPALFVDVKLIIFLQGNILDLLKQTLKGNAS